VRKSDNFDMPDKAYTLLVGLQCLPIFARSYWLPFLAQSNYCGAMVKVKWNCMRVCCNRIVVSLVTMRRRNIVQVYIS